MKFKFFLPLLGVAVAVSFSSCSQNKAGGAGDAETAEQIANGTMPPWIAENSGGYETGSYQSAGSSGKASGYAYNPPSKPSVTRSSSSSRKSTASSRKSAKSTKSARSSKSTSRKKPAVAKSYSVRKGDTLGAIAKRNGVSIKALKQANGLRSDLIHIGQTLKVPKK